MTDKPSYSCPRHPDAMVLHSWDETHAVLNGLPAGTGIKRGHRWECSVCGRELAPPRPQTQKGTR